MAYNVAGMLAQSGQNIGQTIGAPIEKFGVGLGNMMGARQQKQREQEEQKEVKNLLQKYANNPEQLNALGTNASVEGNDELSKIFFRAAKQAVAKKAQNATRGVQGGLTAITQAASRGTPLSALREAKNSVLAQGGTNEDIVDAYSKGVTLAKGEKPEILQGSPGTQFFRRDPATGELVLEQTVPFKPEEEGKGVDKVFELAKTGKYDPASLQDAANPDGSVDYSKLVPKSDDPTRGNVTSVAAKRNNEISEESTKASVSLSRNRALQYSLASGKVKSTGIISDLRTSALNLAGLRDAEEEDKTLFLRTRNTDIVNGLPPGVASDADIEIFSQGFPKENASTEEIMRYLQAEERILASASDMALVSDRHLQTQMDQGLEATMVGFEYKKQQYGTIMQMALKDIDDAKRSAKTEEEAIEAEKKIIKQVSDVLGFVPKFYR